MSPIYAFGAAARSASCASRLRFVVAQGVLFVMFSTVLRVILLARFGPLHLPATSEILRVFGVGLWLDATVASCLSAPAALVLSFSPGSWLEKRWLRNVFFGAEWIWWALVLFVLQAEYFFFSEYRSRFTTVAIDYLHYWSEVSGDIRAMYPVKTVVAVCVFGAAALVWIQWKWWRPMGKLTVAHQTVGFLGWLITTAVLTFGATRVNFNASAERLLNEVASNGLTSGAIALWTRDLDYQQFFPTLPREEAFARSRTLLDTRDTIWTGDPYSLQRHIAGDSKRPKLNVVLLLEESLGSTFWGCLNLKDGAVPKSSLTPHLDEIAAREGMLFTNLYADGNRTIRGIEAVLASIPPLPGDSVVARTKTQGCETLATTLGRDGYHSTFIYPGRGVFDGLRSFALNNGFDRFIEGKDFPHPTFSTIWGHCDEDLYDRVLEEARVRHESGQPFFITALTVSNHQPFTYPDGRIREPSGLHSRKHAVKYVDYALGRFFDRAKNERFWQDTVFAVVADHGARVYGSQTVPILSYEVPLLIVGPAAVERPQRADVSGCQLDVAPTILGLIGRPYDTVFYGRNLLAPAAQRFALLNHNRSIAIFREPDLIALSLGKVVERFTRTDRKTIQRCPLDPVTGEVAKDATALFQTADEIYTQRHYAVQPNKGTGATLTRH